MAKEPNRALLRPFLCFIILLALGVSLFSEYLGSRSLPGLQACINSLHLMCQEPETQWIIFACALINCAVFMGLGNSGGCRRPYIAIFLTLCTIQYVIHYASASTDSHYLVLVWTISLGQATFLCSTMFPGAKQSKMSASYAILAVLILGLLLLVALWPTRSMGFHYRDQERWTGPLNNPNLFGLLMGTGAVMALEIAFFQFRRTSQAEYTVRIIKLSLCSAALMAFGYALLHSYSRGAWVGTLIGVLYLMVQCRKVPLADTKPLPRSAVAVTICLLALSFVLLWRFDQVQGNSHFAQRISSIGKATDFSWKNRVLAWEGALQMITERPMFGFGCNQTEAFYSQYYSVHKVSEGLAIQMNDYLILGVSFGLPGLICFLLYILIIFSNSRQLAFTNEEPGRANATYRAAALVLLSGFFFDGGLFNLPTAATFWILVSLGNESSCEMHRAKNRALGPQLANI